MPVRRDIPNNALDEVPIGTTVTFSMDELCPYVRIDTSSYGWALYRTDPTRHESYAYNSDEVLYWMRRYPHEVTLGAPPLIERLDAYAIV